MNLEERQRTIGTWLVKLLKRYTPPAGMDDETLREEMQLIVNDINNKIPSQFEQVDLDQTLIKVDGHVRANHGARAWPSIKTFINATIEAVKDYSRAIAVPNVTVNYAANKTDMIYARRVLRGDPIPDYLLNPNSRWRKQVIDTGIVSDEDFAKYLAPINK